MADGGASQPPLSHEPISITNLLCMSIYPIDSVPLENPEQSGWPLLPKQIDNQLPWYRMKQFSLNNCFCYSHFCPERFQVLLRALEA